MRVVALYVVVTGLSLYAWKDWYKSLCGLILLMAVIKNEDMPQVMFGINGLNPWNVLFGIIVLAWAASRHREGLQWDLPRHVTALLVLSLGVIVVGVLRAVLDQSHLEGYLFGTKGLINEELINTVKWVLPGLLLFDGCHTRRRVIIALVCLLAMHLVIAVQVARAMPPEAALGDTGDTMYYARLKLNARVGYCATDLSVMLAGACWGTVASLSLVRSKWRKVPVAAAAGLIAYGQALTGGRGGYVAWGMTGLVLCLLKWRKQLLVAPLLLLLLPVVVPGAVARMLEGFGQTDVTGQAAVDREALTAGRAVVWPFVIDKISQSPVIGYGRLAMQRTGLMDFIEDTHPGTGAPHPHNMYLETLLDNGILGSVPILAFRVIVVVYAARLFRSRNRLYSAVGGLALALNFCSLLGGLTGQHVYPQEYTFGLWTATFLALRVYCAESQRAAEAMPVETPGMWLSTSPVRTTH